MELIMCVARIVITAALALVGTSSLAQSVSYDIARGIDFARYKTYAWTKGTELIDVVNHRRVVSAVESQLASKGLIRVEAAARPDALVAYHVSIDPNRHTDPGDSDTLKGTLTLNVLDGKSKKVLWRARVTNGIDSYATAEVRERNINLMAEKVFQNFPRQ
jgi:hypothetical protein